MRDSGSDRGIKHTVREALEEGRGGDQSKNKTETHNISPSFDMFQSMGWSTLLEIVSTIEWYKPKSEQELNWTPQ